MMAPLAWIGITLFSPPELADALADFLTDSGAEGVFQEFPAGGENPPPDTPGDAPGRETLRAYIPDDTQAGERIASIADYLKNLSSLFPDLEPAVLSTERVTDPGWAEEWKKYFKPFRAGKSIIIKPTWEHYGPCNGDTVIEIDPGMAFGTGQHPSTLMCLEAVEDLLSRDPAAGKRVLDAGTGTGILGIAAAKLGAREVVCIDIDEKAVEIARENAIINRVEGHLRIGKNEPSALTGPFSLIVANITSGPLIGMRGDFVRLLPAGGLLVISGILEQDRGETEQHFLASPFRLRRLRREKEWLCYVLESEEKPS